MNSDSSCHSRSAFGGAAELLLSLVAVDRIVVVAAATAINYGGFDQLTHLGGSGAVSAGVGLSMGLIVSQSESL